MELLIQNAEEIAEKTYTDGDSSREQVTKNLTSLISKKSVEMNLLAVLASKTCDEIETHFNDIFGNNAGRVELERIYILEGAELVRRSRQIYLAFREAVEFESNFIKAKSKIPRTYFHRRAINISTMCKAMIFSLHYIVDKITAARHVKQSLKKNNSFKAFGIDMNRVITELTTLGVLTTEQRVKRARGANLPVPGQNNVNVQERRETYFQVLYDDTNNAHKSFLKSYQVIYPGEIFYSGSN